MDPVLFILLAAVVLYLIVFGFSDYLEYKYYAREEEIDQAIRIANTK